MVKIGPPGPALNTLDVLERYTYALTARETWRVINFFHEELQPANVDDIELEDRQCDICTGKFADDLHRAVKLPCNHIFGMKCIERWLRPFKTTMLERNPSLGANTCPKCRRVFFPRQSVLDSLYAVEGRIKLWDLAYAHVGIALSESERRIRADILRYIGISGRLDRRFPSRLIKFRPTYIGALHQNLLSFCRRLKSQTLTPVQEHLRQGLEEIAVRGFQTRNDPDGVRYGRDDQGELFFEPGHGWDPVQSDEGDEEDERDESEEQVEREEESDVLVEDDMEEMRFFRALFR